MNSKINLFDHQKKALQQLRTGSILWGGVGSGKSLTSLAYYYNNEKHKDLYIITTARKRDSLDWKEDCLLFGIKNFIVDSWNNIKRYNEIENAFFIFDEQKVVGSGAWVKSFIKITKSNNWILLTATPGDTWIDYIPVFIANGFYRNRTEFIREHVIYNNYTKFPKIDHYIGVGHLEKLRNQILVKMDYEKTINIKKINITVPFNKDLFTQVQNRWNPFTNLPIKTVSEYCYAMRRVVNSDPSRLDIVIELAIKHKRIIVFYNFNYELELLRTLNDIYQFTVAEYNGHIHEDIPKSNQWIYLVQYVSGSEAWNCIETNAIVFYSLSYSYKLTIQAAGRIDRLNTPFATLFYYYLRSLSKIDNGIMKSQIEKKNFNEREFIDSEGLTFASET